MNFQCANVPCTITGKKASYPTYALVINFCITALRWKRNCLKCRRAASQPECNACITGDTVFHLKYIEPFIMILYTTSIIIHESCEKVFEHITNLNGYTKWLRDITYWEVVTKKIKTGSTQVQHRNFPLSQQLLMTVTGYKKNSYFRLEALSGGIALPAYTFTLRRLTPNCTELGFTLEATVMVNRKTIIAFMEIILSINGTPI